MNKILLAIAFMTVTHVMPASEIHEAKRILPEHFNDSYFDETPYGEFVKRFEDENRDIFKSLPEIIKACELNEGAVIADIGVGTGIFTREFAKKVGPTGTVYAVDVTPKFTERLSEIDNVIPVLCTEKSVNLPEESVDIVFICDSYHHFDFPEETMLSIWQALRPGGKLILIDFERIEGRSREWVLGHLRAGKEVFQAEIENCGFLYDSEIPIDGFTENYFTVYYKS